MYTIGFASKIYAGKQMKERSIYIQCSLGEYYSLLNKKILNEILGN